jgi:uncharacterized protein
MLRELNPFQVAGPLRPESMIDRDAEAAQLFALAEGGHSTRLVAPRRYGKTTLVGRVLAQAAAAGTATALVDLHGVLTMGAIVVRIERAYAASLKGPVRRAVDALLRSWNIGVSLGGGGFTASLQSNPRLDAESVLLRLLDLPAKLYERTGRRSLVGFDEIQDLLRVEGADGVLRSVIQHHAEAASYVFAGSAPTLMRRLFVDPSRPLLEQALPVELGPLPLGRVGDYIEQRFRETGRAAGDALTPLAAFARGHPQRTMLLAHHLWEITPRGSTADETAWVDARERAYRSALPLLQARWEALPVNEQRLAVALTSDSGSIYEGRVLASVGLKKGSVVKTLATLEGRGEAIRRPGGGPELTDPLFAHWLQERGTL